MATILNYSDKKEILPPRYCILIGYNKAGERDKIVCETGENGQREYFIKSNDINKLPDLIKQAQDKNGRKNTGKQKGV